jgi:hypothetical protein
VEKSREEGKYFCQCQNDGFLDIYQWGIQSKIKAHDKAMTALHTLNNYVLSGSSDSTVKFWEADISENGGKDHY